MQNLKNKAINIKGKEYVPVPARVIYFNDTYPNGCIQSEIVEYDKNSIVMKTKVFPDASDQSRFFTGHSHEINDGTSFINKTSMIENAETSSLGRALAMMGIGVIDSIASLDEINKANNRTYTHKSVKCKKCNKILTNVVEKEYKGVMYEVYNCNVCKKGNYPVSTWVKI